MAKQPTELVMGTKPDGTQYARPTRRCAAIVSVIRSGSTYKILTLAEDLEERNLGEFYLSWLNKSVSADRIRTYLTFMIELEMFTPTSDGIELKFSKCRGDSQWAQKLSDTAKFFLAKLLNCNQADVPTRLEDVRRKLHRDLKLPTITKLVDLLGIEGNRNQEFARWAFYMYADGNTCPFQIHRIPTISRSKIS